MDEPSLFSEFPFLVRLRSTGGMVLKGHLVAGGRWWPLVVSVPHYPDLRHLRITTNTESPAEQPESPDLSRCSSVYEAVKLYRDSLSSRPPPPDDGATIADEDDSAVSALRSHMTVRRQLRELGTRHVTASASDLSWVTLSTLDRSARRHAMTLNLAADYPASCPRISADLPVELTVSWHKGSTLLDIYQRFEEAVDKYQDFWTALDRLDAQLWVVDPESPSRRDTRRRIVISGQLSLEVTVDPLYPSSVPGCRFLGAETAAAALRDKLAREIDSWDEYEGLVENLERLLSVEFVRRSAAGVGGEAAGDGGAIAVDCGICYSYRLEGETPERCCDDARCGQPFHTSCLYEWLRALPSTRQTLRTVFGECPYCSTPISCEIPSG
ncbi:E3 ubiquitin-protein ligase FANCL-like [Amphibalanus amphitrite]|uniref:E3 ubiquitin-protein ligase FANCL-like n=1 Tax=Amphibalanus amphitrite TaxID=1232801 RepID=UPI001C904F4B|nr:E3 ubiquitin-protein ligase FANCL-like [Amphibalanus amphitrite]